MFPKKQVLSSDFLSGLHSAGVAQASLCCRLMGLMIGDPVMLVAKYEEMTIRPFDFLSAAVKALQTCEVASKVLMCLQAGPGNESCKDVLLHSDRLMLLDLLYNSMSDIWSQSNCDSKSHCRYPSSPQ